MEFSNNLPIYLQIMNLIKARIVSGEIRGGDKLPSVRDLSRELKVNPNTIQRCYQELEREGLVYTQRGMGTFATEDTEIINNLKTNLARELTGDFVGRMQRLGFSPREIIATISDWIEKEGR